MGCRGSSTDHRTGEFHARLAAEKDRSQSSIGRKIKVILISKSPVNYPPSLSGTVGLGVQEPRARLISLSHQVEA
jgi:hypothetical protein